MHVTDEMIFRSSRRESKYPIELYKGTDIFHPSAKIIRTELLNQVGASRQ